MKSELFSQLEIFSARIGNEVKYKKEYIIELEENISHLDDTDTYILNVTNRLYKIITELFEHGDNIIFCVNTYKDVASKEYFFRPVKLRRYLKQNKAINMVSTYRNNELIEYYFTRCKYADVKIKKLILEITKKDLGNYIDGLDSVFIINMNRDIAIILYDDRYIFIEK